MPKKIYHNYEFIGFGAHGVISTDDKGIIVEAPLPFHKYIGTTIDYMNKDMQQRRPQAYKGLKDLGKTYDGIVVNSGKGD